MNNVTTTLIQSESTTQSVELISPLSFHINSPANWMRNGDSPAEIIMAVAVLVGALTGLLQVLVPVILRMPHKKTK